MATDPRTWIEVSRHALRHNLRQFQRLVGPGVDMLPILKANAYGHGAGLVAQALAHEKVWGFGVAHGDEALDLRQAGIRRRLLVLTSWSAADLPRLIRAGAQVVAWDFPSLAQTQRRFTRRHPPFVHLKLDTGTSRIGFLASDIPRLRAQLRTSKNVAGIFSHLANSEAASSARTKDQLRRFTTLNEQLKNTGGLRHIASTAAAIRYPEAHFGLVRLGIGLYGIMPSAAIRSWAAKHKAGLQLRPALRWQTRLIQVKTVPAGSHIGYGSTAPVRSKTRLGILPVGYSDGLDRGLSNRGWVRLRGQRAPILGRICMNLAIVNLNRISAGAGDTVDLIGPQITAEAMAQSAGTIAYEVLSRLPAEIPRRLV